jgi:hypothetical protein
MRTTTTSSFAGSGDGNVQAWSASRNERDSLLFPCFALLFFGRILDSARFSAGFGFHPPPFTGIYRLGSQDSAELPLPALAGRGWG